MTADQFRRIALSLPGATQSSHLGHADFRVRNKIFATLGYPDDGWGMVKLTPAKQTEFVKAQPTIFAPVKGGWGRQGATSVRLQLARQKDLRPALMEAWRHRAPKALAEEFDFPD